MERLVLDEWVVAARKIFFRSQEEDDHHKNDDDLHKNVDDRHHKKVSNDRIMIIT